MTRERSASLRKRGLYQVRMIGWKDEPNWTVISEGPQQSTLLCPEGRQHHVPNHWFRRVVGTTAPKPKPRSK